MYCIVSCTFYRFRLIYPPNNKYSSLKTNEFRIKRQTKVVENLHKVFWLFKNIDASIQSGFPINNTNSKFLNFDFFFIDWFSEILCNTTIICLRTI